MQKTIALSTLILVAALGLGGCTPDISGNEYDAGDANTITVAKTGVVISMRQVTVDSQSGVGLIAGAIIGGVLGSTVGGGSTMNTVGAVGGAVGGGYLGSKAEQSIDKQQGMEYVIKLDNGDTISIVQATDLHLTINEHVIVLYGNKARIIPDTSYQPTAAGAKPVPAPTPAKPATTTTTTVITTTVKQ